jgi:hypothetical protein
VRLTGNSLGIAAGVMVLGIILGVFLVWKAQRAYDPAFDVHVADPTYKAGGPLVLYDEGHLNTHTASGAYKPLAGLIRSDGYELRVPRQVFSEQTLEGVAVLILALARGTNDANDYSAFTEPEIATIHQWVRKGG